MPEHKKGTTTVALLYKDGVIIAADNRASAGHLAVSKAKKIYKVTDYIGLTTAGGVADANMLVKLLRAEMELYKLEREKDPSVDVAANILSSVIYGNAKSFFPFNVGINLAGKSKEGYKIIAVWGDGSAMTEKYTAVGSGMELALATLDNSWKADLSEEDAIKVAVKAVHTAMKRDVFSGDGIDVAVINQNKYRQVDKKTIESLWK